MSYTIRDLDRHWCWQWLLACSVPSHYLIQWWRIASGTHRSNFQWNLDEDVINFIQENVFENVICKLSTILFWPPCINGCGDYLHLHIPLKYVHSSMLCFCFGSIIVLEEHVQIIYPYFSGLPHYNWDLLQKYHKAPVPYPTIHHFVTEMCTHVHISVTKWCIEGYLPNAL